MREFLILMVIIFAVIILGPVIMSLLIFILCIAAILILLARLGFLPGFRYARYVGDTRGNKSSWTWKRKYHGRADRDARSRTDRSETNCEGGWYQTSQQGEEITLPETALRKEDGKR